MSLESKLANLSLGDEASIIAQIKTDGIEKSGFSSSIDVLVARCGSSDEKEALAALTFVKALAEGVPEAEALTKECLGAALEQSVSKSKDVQKLSKEVALAICKNISPFAMKSLLPM